MLRLQERGGWVDEAQVAVPDHAFLRGVLEKLAFYTGSVFDAVWHHEIQLDGEEHLRVRRKQKLQLSRYGRQPFLSREWDDVDVTELSAWYQALHEMLEEENAVSRKMEDR